VPAVTERLHRLRNGRRTVLLDLDELAFIDARGIGLVLAAAEDSRRDGWSFAVTRGSGAVRLVVDVLGLDDRLPYDGRVP
jgi:anti-anti-sigma factor